MIIGLYVYIKHFIPLRSKEPGFEYVFVNEDGTVSELDEENIKYLKKEFALADGARPYIKSHYKQLTPDKKISGFLRRNRVPKNIKIRPFKNSNEIRIIAWIYLAISIASETEPSDINGISTIADGINHSVPTHKELQTSITWLLSNGLINKVNTKYHLTTKGEKYYNQLSIEYNTLLEMWDKLEKLVRTMPNCY